MILSFYCLFIELERTIILLVKVSRESFQHNFWKDNATWQNKLLKQKIKVKLESIL